MKGTITASDTRNMMSRFSLIENIHAAPSADCPPKMGTIQIKAAAMVPNSIHSVCILCIILFALG